MVRYSCLCVVLHVREDAEKMSCDMNLMPFLSSFFSTHYIVQKKNVTLNIALLNITDITIPFETYYYKPFINQNSTAY